MKMQRFIRTCDFAIAFAFHSKLSANEPDFDIEKSPIHQTESLSFDAGNIAYKTAWSVEGTELGGLSL